MDSFRIAAVEEYQRLAVFHPEMDFGQPRQNNPQATPRLPAETAASK